MSGPRGPRRGRARRAQQPGGVGEAIRRRHAWLDLVQTSGPFLTLPVVHRVFPDGLSVVPEMHRAELRRGVADLLAAGGAGRHRLITTVLCEVLGWNGHLRTDDELPAVLAEPVAEHGLLLRPDFGFWAEDALDADDVRDDDADTTGDGEDATEPMLPATGRGPWRLLGQLAPWGQHPLARSTTGGWTASPIERLAVLLRARDVPIGLVTDGRWWALVWAPRGGTTGAAVWDASLWSEEPDTLRAFVALMERARFLAVPAVDTLPALLRESLERQEEVTETLGRQVRDAVELLVATFDRLDADSGRRLLAGADDDELYAGVVTVMMRVVFLLFAEERRLLPSDDDLYVRAYGIGRLVDQLESQASLLGEQALEHRTGAWHRLLALTRAVHQGVAHENLRLPAYGGAIFDPDRHPWLEGRSGPPDPSTHPPAIDNRTVLRMLRAVQYVELGGERRRLTFRTLDVEQIGYVYEGLLELEVRTAHQVTLGLLRPAKWPKAKEDCDVALDAAKAAPADESGLAEWITARTGLSMARAAALLATPSDREALLRAVNGDRELATRLAPFAAVPRSSGWRSF